MQSKKRPQMKLFRSFTKIINYKTLIVTALSVVSTYLCYQYHLIAKFPDMLVGVAIVFPVVFSIGSAYNRRETALQKLSDFKGHAAAIYFATRDWHTQPSSDLHIRIRDHIHTMLLLMRDMFRVNKESWQEYEKKMYVEFSILSKLVLELRNLGVQSGEISRISQYVSKMVVAFDNMKIFHAYRTPVTLRAYSKVFLYIFPIVYGPYFASTVADYSASLEYVMPVLYSFILVSLDNIQDHLENPFDEVGEDDIIIEAEETTQLLA
jgi:predicted membrane chloride channel (bestrophin family)